VRKPAERRRHHTYYLEGSPPTEIHQPSFCVVLSAVQRQQNSPDQEVDKKDGHQEEVLKRRQHQLRDEVAEIRRRTEEEGHDRGEREGERGKEGRKVGGRSEDGPMSDTVSAVPRPASYGNDVPLGRWAIGGTEQDATLPRVAEWNLNLHTSQMDKNKEGTA